MALRTMWTVTWRDAVSVSVGDAGESKALAP
jgi:hypothetical protein